MHAPVMAATVIASRYVAPSRREKALRIVDPPAAAAPYFAPVATGRSARAPHSDHEPS
jgi:hypothetical protein